MVMSAFETRSLVFQDDVTVSIFFLHPVASVFWDTKHKKIDCPVTGSNLRSRKRQGYALHFGINDI